MLLKNYQLIISVDQQIISVDQITLKRFFQELKNIS